MDKTARILFGRAFGTMGTELGSVESKLAGQQLVYLHLEDVRCKDQRQGTLGWEPNS